jgi:glycosyltransferase involved in cell wall biosynthesis
MARPKLLFLCQTLPYPPDGGVAIRSFNVLRLLAARYDVTALCFYRRAAAVDVDASLAALSRIVNRVEAFPIEQEYARGRLLIDHLRSVMLGRVYTVAAYESRAFRQRLSGLLQAEQFDVAHMDSLDLSAYLPLLARIPTVCVHHNVESALLRRRAATEPKLALHGYLRLQAWLMEREERRWCPRVALNVAVSEADRMEFERLAPSARVTVVPNGVDVTQFVPRGAGTGGIVFVGGMTWFPNKDALQYFAREILPRVRAAGCQDNVTWVGRALPGASEAYGALGVNLTGYVDDIRPYVGSAACYVVPLRVGGGTRLKILDAWAMGKAVVSTPIGCEGLDARDGWNILIRDDPQEFADAVRIVLTDPALRATLGANARLTAERVYSWDVIGEAMYGDYESVRRTATAVDTLATTSA